MAKGLVCGPGVCSLNFRGWHIADDVLAALKVRYAVGSPAATHLGERPESAQPCRPTGSRRRSGVHPLLPIADRIRMDRSRPKAVTRGRVTSDNVIWIVP
jgi:hypothetical protein